MRPSFARCKRWVLVAGILLPSLATPAFAQKKGGDERPPFDVNGLPHDGWGFIPWVFVFGFTGGILLNAFKNPHRGHAD